MNKTIYVIDKDAPIWEAAERLIPVMERTTLSRFITQKLREYVQEKESQFREAVGEEIGV